MKFRIGEKVKVLKKPGCANCRGTKGCPHLMEIGIIKELGAWNDSESIWVHKFPSGGGCSAFREEHLIKIGGVMSKHEELKDRIEALDDGWNKDADDVITEIAYYGRLIVDNGVNNNDGYVNIVGHGSWIGNGEQNVLINFRFMGQCEKMSAFKKALMWLLDHSDIKKDDGEKIKKIAHLEIYLQEIKDNYNDSIRKVEAKIKELK